MAPSCGSTQWASVLRQASVWARVSVLNQSQKSFEQMEVCLLVWVRTCEPEACCGSRESLWDRFEYAEQLPLQVQVYLLVVGLVLHWKWNLVSPFSLRSHYAKARQVEIVNSFQHSYLANIIYNNFGSFHNGL